MFVSRHSHLWCRSPRFIRWYGPLVGCDLMKHTAVQICDWLVFNSCDWCINFLYCFGVLLFPQRTTVIQFSWSVLCFLIVGIHASRISMSGQSLSLSLPHNLRPSGATFVARQCNLQDHCPSCIMESTEFPIGVFVADLTDHHPAHVYNAREN